MEGTAPGSSPIAKLTRPFILLGIGLIVLGGLSIYAPQQSGMAVGILVGIFLIVSGLFRAAVFWIATSWGSAILRLLLGLIAVAAGVVMITNPSTGLRAITIVAIAYLLVDGATEILFALRLPPGAGGIWIMLSGVASVVLGVLIWRGWPVTGELAIGILIGAKLILDGVALIATASAARAVGAAISRV
jgi:uncharacterized membrane protein HdeD (DUF308 family)